jgi:hypothetical protein
MQQLKEEGFLYTELDDCITVLTEPTDLLPFLNN